jgi:ABC-type oligopeptide transport system ATPase subunit
MADDLLVASRLVVSYERPSIGLFSKRDVGPPVLRGVNFRITKGETVGIVGESGSGKTTFGRALLGLVKPVAGSVVFDGQDITALDECGRRPLCRRIQMIFQDPMSSLNPRHTIGRILIEPVLLHGLAKSQEEALVLVHNVLDRVGLSRRTVDRYSYELSGGQRQRVGIARAVVLRPDFVLADEIVSGLDVSTQAQVLQLLKELTSEMHLALAFISHDLSVIRSICERVIVMREGRVVEEGPCERVFAAPRAAYSRMLIDAIPLPTVDPGWLTREVAGEAERETEVPSEPATYDVRLVRESLEKVARLLDTAGKKTQAKAVQSVIELLVGHDSESIPTFLKALQEQLERKPEKKAAPSKDLRTETIEQYVRQLHESGTDKSAFDSVFARLSKDKAVRKAEADAVAHAYGGGGARWPKKQDAFAAIRAHFDTMLHSETKIRQVRKASL